MVQANELMKINLADIVYRNVGHRMWVRNAWHEWQSQMFHG